MTRIFTDGCETGCTNDFWKKISAKTSNKNPVAGSFFFDNYKLIKLTIKNGDILLETDIAYYLAHSDLINKRCTILILAECSYCHHSTEIGKFCEYCGAPMI
jgi:hypothetical protein